MDIGVGMKRTVLQAVARAKLDDAVLLLEHQRWSNAYYLAGYAVEIGLKACIARRIVGECIPDRKFIDGIYRHEFKELLRLSGLETLLKIRIEESDVFGTNWLFVSRWRPDIRYGMIEEDEASTIIRATADQEDGVFPWITRYW